ncbi:MAG: undecaprenyl/decaprenyl-phosphate alpha-N-acetylglucosaminyl 1-phosphate transferase [Gammaproteobacteria bacterium]|nr:undecaprenyl/decaprenyl-phosphate alpha-N-acetylglucosaminyl 1-phosphate transferase [Gammaproteobacteria bacterium]
MSLLLASLIALSITTACMPGLQRWALRVGLTDRPGPRKVHRAPVPRVGGIAMAAGILVPALLMVPLRTPMIGFLGGVVVLLAFGLWDDRCDLDYRLKFLGQFLGVTLCIAVGHVRIAELTLDHPVALPHAVSWLLTFGFLVGVTNAMNLADGLDGLAGGVALLCLLAIAVFGAICGNHLVMAVALIESGAILGFLRFNTHPAQVFMGDGGSQVLGFSIGVLSILATQGDRSALSASLPILLLGLPILDTVAVMLRRALAGRSPFASDRSHLHHRLLELGFAHHEAVVSIYCVQLGLFLLAYFLRFESDLLILAVFGVFSATMLAMLRLATSRHWHAHTGSALPIASALMSRLRQPAAARRISQGAAWLMGCGFVAYAATVIVARRHVEGDISVLSASLLLLVLGLSYFGFLGSLSWLERLTAYVGVIMLVYLDQTAAVKTPLLASLTWGAVMLTAAGALVRVLLSQTRRFEVSALDVLVAFVAVVIPNLPGFVSLPPDLPGGILKALVLLYVVEMTEGAGTRRLVPRTLLAMLLAAVTLRGLMPLVP